MLQVSHIYSQYLHQTEIHFSETGMKTDSKVYCSMFDVVIELINDIIFESSNC